MRIHHIQRHLNSIELEAMLRGRFQHIKVNPRIFMSGESDEPNFPCLLSFQDRRSQIISEHRVDLL